eukprot:gnl/TRDRNA2_/TRDRNA2_135095_c0_seq1.p1 gnl/TRDRNA2_/TRDRNA2_135095_c0~~gnl/TRDRNA2_/TRDRNA2_135095_c0_seq1.p1  ORF type:complete len:778 (+),score=143.32 gnl/TRDRNA2_/TRDRNA2_135095_c0_seq1:109-2442(+)
MALQAVTEVALHVGLFRNVDLFHQGLYHLRCRVFQDRGDQAVDAVPHVFRPDDEASTSTGVDAPQQPLGSKKSEVLPAAVAEDEVAFRSRSFLIRYCEEEVEINEIGQFRIEQDADRDMPLMLEVKLMFLDIAPKGGADVFDPELSTFNPPKILESEFTSVSSQLFKLHGTLTGLHSYCPVVFDEFHFCQVGLIVHTSLIDFRLRLRPQASSSPYGRSNSDMSGEKAPVSLTEALIELAGGDDDKEKPDGDEDGQQAKADGEEANAAASSAEPPSETDRLAVAIDRLQADYVGRLVSARGILVTFLSKVQTELKNPQSRWTRLNVKPIVYPGQGDVEQGLVPLARRLESVNAPAAARLLAQDLSALSGQVLEVWQFLLRNIPYALGDLTAMLRKDWEQEVTERWGESIFREMCSTSELSVPSDHEIFSTHGRIADKLRQSKYYKELKPYPVEDLSISPSHSAHPILFEQRYGDGSGDLPASGPDPAAGTINRGPGRDAPACSNGANAYPGVHVFVLVHGFQGNSFDMRLMKNNIALLYPNAIYLCSMANEEDTEGDLMDQGANLAEEVRNFIREECPGRPAPTLGRLSFVAHSIGGLIVRSALSLLVEEYGDKMFTFLTFATPHLGYMYAANSMFKTGLWFVTKLRRSKCLEQLSMTDVAQPEDSCLSQLSQMRGLERFQHVVLVSSYQDQYAPFESARVEVSPAAEGDKKLGPFFMKLAQSILAPVQAEKLIRFNVDFHIPETNLDTMIGRAAHILFLESQPLMKMLVHTYGFLFE